MKKSTLIDVGFIFLLISAWAIAWTAIPMGIGTNGFFGNFFLTHTVLKLATIFVVMAHLTISAMSICFHRQHTHQALRLSKGVDMAMQTWLWAISSISKLDWVSVHVYHHVYSDTDKDPHSPKQKGLAHVFFLGVFDYAKAKGWPEVRKIRERIPANAYERFIAGHTFMAPVILTALLMIAFGPKYGTILSVLNFAITPLFAVGGVNALAHAFGYQNYDSKDESRNLGFLVPLNWIIAGELDHNNHHKYPKSPNFAHRWFEFDFGFFYVRGLNSIGLAAITGTVPRYVDVVSKSEVAITA